MSRDNFTYSYFLTNRYGLPKLKEGDMEYEGICNNGFTKLCTEICRVYWIAQNDLEHKTPDWKFHVSVVEEDVPRAWDLLINLFMDMKCRSGMKVAYLKESTNTAPGREITIYIYKHHEGYDTSELCEGRLSIADEHSEDYWFEFYNRIEVLLRDNNIRERGCAKGDLPLGRFVSLRNEAFVQCPVKDVGIYPPDECGWNVLGHTLPFDIGRFGRQKGKSAIVIYLIFCSIVLLFFAYVIKNNY
jgi:hypothetical protein